jgi:hypothetical protein
MAARLRERIWRRAAGESLFATSISLPDGAWLSFIQDGEIILHHLKLQG